MGRRCEILITKPDVQEPDAPPIPPDTPLRKLRFDGSPITRARWATLRRYLELRAPCVYVPNHDFLHSALSPVLSRRVIIAGVLHSDDDESYEHVRRLGPWWDLILCASQAIADQVRRRNPSLHPRIHAIPHGVELPPFEPLRSNDPSGDVRLLFVGRLTQRHKRVLDIPPIVSSVRARGIRASLTMVGSGPEEAPLRTLCAQLGLADVAFLPPQSMAELSRLWMTHDILLLTSESEGLPLALLEGMAYGCVPVVSDLPSGIPEVVRDGINGFRVPVGDIHAFADRIDRLARSPSLRVRMSTMAFRTIRDGPFRADRMAQEYWRMFEWARFRAEQGIFRRPKGEILPWPGTFLNWRDRLPEPVWRLAQRVKRLVR